MLVLSRHREESIMIGDDVRVMIVEMRGDKVRLGIDAPLEVPVHRKEVFDAIVANGQNPTMVRRMAAAVRLHNHLSPESEVVSLEDLTQTEQVDLMLAVDAVMGSGVLV